MSVYLSNGWSSHLLGSSSSDDKVHALAVYNSSFVLCASQSSLQMWTLEHTQSVPIASAWVSNLSGTIDNIAVINQQLIAAITSKNHIRVFKVEKLQETEKNAILAFNRANWHDESSLEIPNFSKYGITYLYAFALPESAGKIECVQVVYGHIVLVTEDSFIRFISPSGEAGFAYLDSDSAQNSRKVLGITFINGLIGFRLSHSVIVVQMDENKFTAFLQGISNSCHSILNDEAFSNRVELPIENSVSFELYRDYLAVGLESGSVLVYKIYRSPSLNLELYRSISLRQWDYSSSEIGAPLKISFSEGGRCIAVGYSKRGLAIWTVEGCRVFSTFPAVACPPASSEILSNGVSSIAWSEDNSSVLVAGNGENEFFRIPIVRTSSNASTLLIGGNFLSIWKRIFISDEAKSSDNNDWEFIQVNGAYMRDNGPIKYACVSPSEEQIAVAGKHGAALYNRTLGKWRVFGNVNQEKLIASNGIAWVGEYIICIANGSELLFYPRTHLDNRSLIFMQKLSHSIVSIDVSIGPHDCFVVAVLLDSGDIECMELYCSITDPTSGRTRDYPVNKDEVLSGEELSPQKMRIQLKPIGKSFLDKFEDRPKKISLWWRRRLNREVVFGLLILLDHGELLLAELSSSNQKGRNSVSTIASDIEQFWTQTYPQAENFFCTYGMSYGFEIWFANLQEQDAPIDESILTLTPRRRHSFGLGSLIDSESLFEYNSEIHPLGVDWSLGVVVAAHRGMRFGNLKSSAGCCFSVQTQIQPFADGVLRYLVTDGTRPLEEIIRIARVLQRSSPYFFVSLELLLHTVMDYDVLLRVSHNRNSRRQDSGVAVSLEQWMPRVLKFLKNFDEYHELVASCARKTDYSHWGRLFPLGGTPIQLFEECLMKKKFEVASKYLLIIQRSEGSTMAYRQGLRLLRSLKVNNVDSNLYKEVQRFLRMSVRRKESDLRSPLPTSSSSPRLDSSSQKKIVEYENSFSNEEGRTDIISPGRAEEASSGMLGGVFKWLGWS